MTEDLITVLATDRLTRARDLLLGLGLHALPVIERDDVVGIVTSLDLVDDWPSGAAVSDAMTTSLNRIDAQASVSEAAEAMISDRIHHLLVAQEGEIIGILSSLDLLQVFRQ